MTRKACVLGQTTETSNDAQSGCPLARLLPHMTKDFDTFMTALIDLGMVRRTTSGSGIYEFAIVDHPCPFTQKQSTTQPLEEQP